MLQAGLLALLTFASLPIRRSGQWRTTSKGAYPGINRDQDYSGGTTSGLHGIPY